MKPALKIVVRRRRGSRAERSVQEIAELRAVRERFQRDKPTLEQVLTATGQSEAMPLGEYIQVHELLRALRHEKDKQRLTLAQLARKTGYDPAVLSRLFTGRQANTTLATVARIANALGKEVVHTLRDTLHSGRAARKTKTAKRSAKVRADS